MTDDQTNQADELTEMWDAESLREALDASPPPATSPATSSKEPSSVELSTGSDQARPRVIKKKKQKNKKKRKQKQDLPVLILVALIVTLGSFLLVRLMS